MLKKLFWLIIIGAVIWVVFFSDVVSKTLHKQGSVVLPEKNLTQEDWQIPLNDAGIGVKTLTKTAETSTHLLALKGKEKPHVHDTHDLTAIVLSGKVNIHFKDRTQEMTTGDVVSIPRGTFHWAENICEEQSQIYVIFNPPFDGKDRRFVE